MCPVRTKNINSLLWRGYDIPKPLKAEINLLFNMSVNELRAKYREVLGFCTNSRNRDFLVRKIAWKIQSDVFGGITERMREKAYEIADFSRLRVRDTIIPKAAFSEGTCPPKKIALKHDPRLPMCGALLSRTYRGRRIVVKVLDDAFEFEGRRYSALSGIARDVTGTNWNGFKFFNL